MKRGGQTMPFTVAAHTMVPGLRWLCSLMHTSGSRSVFRAGLPWLRPPNLGLRGSSVIPAEGFLVRERHARQVQGLQMPFATDREHADALQHVTAKFSLAKRFSAVNLGARTGLKHRAWRSSCWARDIFERGMSSELSTVQSLPWRLGHGRFDLGQTLTRSTPFQQQRSNQQQQQQQQPVAATQQQTQQQHN